jgi:hypothetical protein
MHNGIAIIMGRGNIQKGNFIRAFSIVTPRDFDWITRIPDINEFHAFYYPTIINIQARDNTLS